MSLIKLCFVVGVAVLYSSSALGDDTGTDQKVATTIKTVNEEEPDNYPSLPVDGNLLRLFAQIFRPVKISGKTYGPNVVAIIGDKPYISMEIFNKFSPFRWLLNAFQGKVQNVCNLLAPFPDDGSSNPENVIQQILQDSQQKPSGSGKFQSSGPVRIYDVPVGYRHPFNKN